MTNLKKIEAVWPLSATNIAFMVERFFSVQWLAGRKRRRCGAMAPPLDGSPHRRLRRAADGRERRASWRPIAPAPKSAMTYGNPQSAIIEVYGAATVFGWFGFDHRVAGAVHA